MCLAIYKPADVDPDRDSYRTGYLANNHGAGFVVADKGKLLIRKGFFDFDEFWEAFERYYDCPALIHFRWATHGKRDKANCHPFSISKDLAMIHNGVLSIDTSKDRSKSDTWHYVESILKPLHQLDADFYKHDAIKFQGEQAIQGSKFAFLRADGDFSIWNEDDGHWADDGHWYSNSTYKTFYDDKTFYTEEDEPFDVVSWMAGDTLDDALFGADY